MEKIIIEEEFDDLEIEVRRVADKLNELIDWINDQWNHLLKE